MKSPETPNKGKNSFDIALERGEDTPTLEQLKEFKPEAFGAERLIDSVLIESNLTRAHETLVRIKEDG